MDVSALEALASVAGTAVVTAAMTDAWEDVRHKVAKLFSHSKARTEIEQRLDATHAQLAATDGAELARVQAEQAARWSGRLADLLADRPEAEADLRALVTEIQSRFPAAASQGTSNAPTASGPGSIAIGGDAKPSAGSGGIAAAVIQGSAVVVNPQRPDPGTDKADPATQPSGR
jgi:hypothetical protein